MNDAKLIAITALWNRMEELKDLKKLASKLLFNKEDFNKLGEFIETMRTELQVEIGKLQ